MDNNNNNNNQDDYGNLGSYFNEKSGESALCKCTVHLLDIGPFGTKIFNFENVVTSKSGFRSLKVIENDSFDRPHASVC